MSGIYDKEGVKFLYPENWEVSEESADELSRVISLQSPTSGFWTLHVYEASAEPAELVAEARQTLAQEYDSLEAEPANEKIARVDTVGYDLEFYCLDLVVTARIRSFRQGKRTYLVLAQAESRDFEKLGDVFRAMTVSLLAHGSVRP
jgi:hypothetical protein